VTHHSETLSDASSSRRDAEKTFTMHLRGGHDAAGGRNVSLSCQCAGRMRRAGGPSGAGKSSILKMIYGNYRVDRGRSRSSIAAAPSISPPPIRAQVLEMRRDTHRLCQPVPAHRAARRRTRCRRRAADRAGVPREEAQRCGRIDARPPQPARSGCGNAARDLLRRRAAARQHRPRLHHRSCRCCCSTSRPPRSMRSQPRRGRRDDRREEGQGTALLGISTTKMSVTSSPTGSSTSPPFPHERQQHEQPSRNPSLTTRLGEEPLVHPTAVITQSTLGRFTEITEHCKITETRSTITPT
jgi:hypothetical protein